MKKILAIGNSFSEDATAYLHDIAQQDDEETKIVNLYIGGCSLQTHDENAVNDTSAYRYELNGNITNRYVSIKEALLEEDWNIVTLQQASHYSGIEKTYYPYIINLSDYVKKYVPSAKQMIHQTWAYEIDSNHDAFGNYNHNQTQMYDALKEAYEKASNILRINQIPCGDVIQKLRSLNEFDYAKGGQSLCRDGYHMHFVYGRYAIAATWYETIFQKSVISNTYMPLKRNDEVYDENLISLIKRTVHEICKK